MIKIELVKFEAQDVITASVMKPVKPNKPNKPNKPQRPTEPATPETSAPTCTCEGMRHDEVQTNMVWLEKYGTWWPCDCPVCHN